MPASNKFNKLDSYKIMFEPKIDYIYLGKESSKNKKEMSKRKTPSKTSKKVRFNL